MPPIPDELKDIFIQEPELRRLVSKQMEYAAMCLKDPTDSLTPCLAVLCKSSPDDEGEMAIFALATDFTEADEKRAVLRKIGKLLYEQRTIPVGAALACEAWLSTQQRSEKHIEPCLDPAKREVVIVQGLTLGTRISAMAVMEVSRQNGLLVPGKQDEVKTQGVTCQLLNYLFDGFADAMRANYLTKPN